ncbi:MAG: ABC transporter permease [Anaerolinea sp.]|nr:ABC transporter permease [Anaerolinea sp.]
MHVFFAIVKKEISSVLRDRTILIAVLIQLFVASFSSALLVGMLSLYDADSAQLYNTFRIRAGLIGTAPVSFVNALEARGVNTLPLNDLNDALAQLNRGELQAVMVMPAADTADLVEIQLYLPPEGALSSMVLNYLQEPLKKYENSLRAANGLTVRYTDLKGTPPTTYEFLYTIILPLLMFFPAFIAGNMVIDSISEEIQNQTLDTLLAAPLTLNQALLAKMTAALVLALLQALTWILLLRLNGTAIQHPVLILSLMTLMTGLICVLAATIVLLFRDRERSQFVYSLSLLAGNSLLFAIEGAPLKTMARFAVGDVLTTPLNLLPYAALLMLSLLLLLRFSHRFQR